jgi:DNA-binding PadR family transcriptional regulator
MSLPHIILGMLRHRPKSGYDLKKELENVIHYFWEADISRIYRWLAEMEAKGWVQSELIVQDQSPNKRTYALTEAGRREMEAWLAAPGKPAGSNNPFLAQLHFSDAIPVEAQVRVLEARRDALRDELAELERRARQADMPVPLPEEALRRGFGRHLLSLEYGIRYYRFQIEWTEDTLRLLRQAGGGGEREE